MLSDWHTKDAAEQLLPTVDKEEMKENIQHLLDATAIVEKNSTLSDAENEFERSWGWGIPAAIFHFSLNDKSYLSIEDVQASQTLKIVHTPSPNLHTTNEKYENVIDLDSSLKGNDLLQLMSRRRTIREVNETPVTRKQLSDCLFAGMGITGHTHNNIVQLPLSMTPSGGARNPYEAYVYARNVEGLEPGFYHYSALEHSLGRMPAKHLPNPSELLAGQYWADDMPCIILLAAMLERSMWKYTDANAYRGALIEAGHIGQNIMIAATKHELTACPTAAFCHSALHDCLEISGATQTAVYALCLGSPKKDDSIVMYQ